MTDLTELLRQRDVLNERIAEAETARARSWDEALTEIRSLLESEFPGVPAALRKNVVTVTVAGRVRVELGYPSPPGSESFAVTWGTGSGCGRASFSAVPPADAVLALVRELVTAEV